MIFICICAIFKTKEQSRCFLDDITIIPIIPQENISCLDIFSVACINGWTDTAFSSSVCESIYLSVHQSVFQIWMWWFA